MLQLKKEREKVAGMFFWSRLLCPAHAALAASLFLFWQHLTGLSRIPGTNLCKHSFVKYSSRRLSFQLSFTSENFLTSSYHTFAQSLASCVSICCSIWDVVTQLRWRLNTKTCHPCHHGGFQEWSLTHQLPQHCRELHVFFLVGWYSLFKDRDTYRHLKGNAVPQGCMLLWTLLLPFPGRVGACLPTTRTAPVGCYSVAEMGR